MQLNLDSRFIGRQIPEIEFIKEVECKHCNEKFDVEVYVDSEKVEKAIDKFIDETDEEDIIEWAGAEHLNNYKVIEYINENIELLQLNLITKDAFIEGLLEIADIKINLFDIKNVK